MTSAVAIITARGGSKRIPHKNIRDFLGKPILAYSIEAALASGLFDEVMVSTDSLEIAKIAEEYGASVPFFRSEETSGDFATTADVIREVMDAYAEEGKTFDVICCVYPTAPFVTAEKLQEGACLLSDDVDAVVPVVQFSFPPQRGFVVEKGLVEYCCPEYRMVRSQDLEPIYHDVGQFYFCKVNTFFECGSLIPPRTAPLVLDESECQDIDNESDWKIAEAKYSAMLTRGVER